MLRRPFKLLAAALLYGGALMGANAAAGELAAAEFGALAELRRGEMAKLVLHETPRPAFGATVYDRHGNPVRLADLRGRVVVLNFWATWCPPCRREMPSLDRLAGAFPEDDLVVVALSTDRGGVERPAAFLDGIGVEKLLFLHDRTGAAGREAGILGLPITLLLDRDGREVGRLIGDAEWDGAAARELIGRLIELTRGGTGAG